MSWLTVNYEGKCYNVTFYESGNATVNLTYNWRGRVCNRVLGNGPTKQAVLTIAKKQRSLADYYHSLG